MATLFGMFPFLQKLFADGGYQGPEFTTALATREWLHLDLERWQDGQQREAAGLMYRREHAASCR